MEDSGGACLMHPFSYASSALPHEPNQGNPMHALGESISFGRFMSESLAWEKWSTFSHHNRYVEEAERSAQPGSVAQKKAFFEAHYKRIAAAKKAAALLEQGNAATACNTRNEQPPEPETPGLDDIIDRTTDSRAVTTNSHETEAEARADDTKPDLYVNADDNEQAPSIKSFESQVGGTYLVEEPEASPMETPVKKDLPSSAENVDNQDRISRSDLSGTPQMEKPLLKQSSGSSHEVSSATSKRKSAFSSLKSSVYRKTSKVPCSPAKPVTPRIKKENIATPITKKSMLDFSDKKRSTPKSQQRNFISTPAKEPDKSFGPATRKAETTRIASDKASQNCTTPLRTPNMAASARMSKQASATPRSENTRNKTPSDGSKTTVPKWHILSAVCSKSLTACRNKLQSPTLSTPFILRTEERAARRKQKLEEKFNSKEVQKVQLQTKLKEKAESELRKLRQSFCFKARALPDFYKDREAAKVQMNKISATQPQSPKLGRKPITRGMTSAMSIHKSSISKYVSSKNSQHNSTNSSFPSLPEMNNHENTSPNIQY